MKAGFWEILLVVVLILILFGHNKIPDLMKNLANGINVFKKELKGDEAQDNGKKTEAVSAAPVKSVAKKTAAKKAPAKKTAAQKAVAKKKK
ncbi:MAG: twin-arginine translocase TatA/TatE family subunit [Rickettsiales bacterium]|jgi:TatA/E family protein of Tat protein translocase|nr:twin-arginine translocase TatA/TatE family subunit [Rickettsiales bacterium]